MKELITTSEKAAAQFKHIARKMQEHFCIITLNPECRMIRKHIITIGLLTETLIHPREIFYKAIKDLAAMIILIHNHPSGTLKASKQDDEITRQLIFAGKILGIPVVDHVIISRHGYKSIMQSSYSLEKTGFENDEVKNYIDNLL